jgi:hypothetical protein
MKLMVSAKPFTAELKSVLPAIATRSGLPMLPGVRLEASDGEVSIEATDLELTARRVVRGDVTVDGAGSVVVPEGSGQGRRGDERTGDRARVALERRPSRTRCSGR